MLKLELVILIIAIVVFILQYKIRFKENKAAAKLIYWTILFFVSLAFNAILYNEFNKWYRIDSYLNLSTLLTVCFIAVGYILIQVLSPFKYINKFIQWKKNKNKRKDIEEDTEIKVCSNQEKQDYFEMFLETICWLGFISTFAIQVIIKFAHLEELNLFIQDSVVFVMCFFVMLGIPIAIRQIIYYLFRIRDVKAESLTKDELELRKKLNHENIKL